MAKKDDTYPSLIKIISVSPLTVYIPNWAPVFDDEDEVGKHKFRVSTSVFDKLPDLSIDQYFRCRLSMGANIAKELKFYDLEEVVITPEDRSKAIQWLKKIN